MTNPSIVSKKKILKVLSKYLHCQSTGEQDITLLYKDVPAYCLSSSLDIPQVFLALQAFRVKLSYKGEKYTVKTLTWATQRPVARVGCLGGGAIGTLAGKSSTSLTLLLEKVL